jgi:hypothetical protein
MNRLLEFTRRLRRRKPTTEERVSVLENRIEATLGKVSVQIATEKQAVGAQRFALILYEGDVTIAPNLKRIAMLTGVRVGGFYHALPEPVVVQPDERVVIVFGGPTVKDGGQ